MNPLIEKLFAITDALEEAGYRHAFGGAIALAYCTREPRGTRDLDVNIFAPAEDAETVLHRLPAGVAVRSQDVEAARRNGQVRLWWDETPVDAFLSNIEFHDQASRHIVPAVLAGREISVLDCVSLTVFKAYFDRGKDWVDIETMAERDATIIELAAATIAGLSGSDDPRRGRLLRIAARQGDARSPG